MVRRNGGSDGCLQLEDRTRSPARTESAAPQQSGSRTRGSSARRCLLPLSDDEGDSDKPRGGQMAREDRIEIAKEIQAALGRGKKISDSNCENWPEKWLTDVAKNTTQQKLQRLFDKNGEFELPEGCSTKRDKLEALYKWMCDS